MPHSSKLSRRRTWFGVPAFAALLLGFAACDSSDSFNPDSSASPDLPATEQPAASPVGTNTQVDTLAVTSDAGPSLAAGSFAGGIAFGTFAQPTSWFGSVYNGAKRTIGPGELRSELAAIKSRGGKIVLMMAGSERYYKDGSGHFSLTKWKQRIDRFKGIDFSSYVADGTIIGHYLIDEPQDATNWNGEAVSPSTVDEMGRYSKQLWPGMATVVRTEPRFFKSNPRYVDAAWAQYLARFGSASDYLRRNVAEAQDRGIALIVGLNLMNGGTPNKTAMTAAEVKSFGTALLNSTYPCAFISWQHNDSFLSSTSVRDAMQALRNMAENRSARSCRAS